MSVNNVNGGIKMLKTEAERVLENMGKKNADSKETTSIFSQAATTGAAGLTIGVANTLSKGPHESKLEDYRGIKNESENSQDTGHKLDVKQ